MTLPNNIRRVDRRTAAPPDYSGSRRRHEHRTYSNGCVTFGVIGGVSCFASAVWFSGSSGCHPHAALLGAWLVNLAGVSIYIAPLAELANHC
jgi:hypothetical protein